MKKKLKQLLRPQSLLYVLACALIMSLSFSATYAWLIDRDEVMNEFVAAEDEIIIEEDFEPPEELLPGSVFVKAPRVINTGNVPTFVRVRVVFSNVAALDILEPLDFDRENWYEHEDGFFYFRRVLQPGESTTDLFTQVRVREDVTVSDMLDFEIIIYAESSMQPDPNEERPFPLDQEYRHIWHSGW